MSTRSMSFRVTGANSTVIQDEAEEIIKKYTNDEIWWDNVVIEASPEVMTQNGEISLWAAEVQYTF